MKYILQILIGACLITSGFIHQISMQAFEVRLVDLFGMDWIMVPIFGRLWSAFELFVGLNMIFRINPKRTTSYFLALITLFVLYDAMWDAFFNPNPFYLMIWPFQSMNPGLFATLKVINAVLLLAFVIYDFKTIKSTDLKYKWIKFLFPIGALCYTFIYNAVVGVDFKDAESEHRTGLTIDEIDSSVKESYDSIKSDGDQLLMFVSLSCSHCFYTTRKVATIKRQYPDMDIRLILFSEKNLEKFQKFARAEEIPHSVIESDEFMEVTGGKVPAILYVKDDKVQKQWDSGTFNYTALSFVQNLN